jgi:hypothetical protein
MGPKPLEDALDRLSELRQMVERRMERLEERRPSGWQVKLGHLRRLLTEIDIIFGGPENYPRAINSIKEIEACVGSGPF